MSLHDVLPLDEIKSRFDKPVSCLQLGLLEYQEIVRLEPPCLGGTALNAWNRIESGGKLRVNKYAVVPYIEPNGVARPEVVDAISAIIKEPLVKDISYSHCTLEDPALADQTVAKLMLVRVYPNDLHIADVHFRNPYKPIPEDRQTYYFREYEGLGLLGTVLDRIESCAKEQGCDFVTLTCAHPDLIPLFSRYGFTVETSEFGRMAGAMEKKVG